jgi:hypothetical protein
LDWVASNRSAPQSLASALTAARVFVDAMMVRSTEPKATSKPIASPSLIWSITCAKQLARAELRPADPDKAIDTLRTSLNENLTRLNARPAAQQ